MKTPSGTIGLVTIATIAAAVVAALVTFAQPPPPTCPLPNKDLEDPPLLECASTAASNEEFVLRIKHRHQLKDPVDGDYGSAAALKTLINNPNGPYDGKKGNRIHLIRPGDTNNNKRREWLLKQEKGASATELEIKTDKITVSKSAESLPTDDLTLISPHVTQQIAVSSPQDVTAVLNLLAK